MIQIDPTLANSDPDTVRADEILGHITAHTTLTLDEARAVFKDVADVLLGMPAQERQDILCDLAGMD